MREYVVKIYKPSGKCNISGERLRATRESVSLSQEQLAARLQLAGLNVTQKTISRMENGQRVIADYELPFLAEALDVTVYYLLGLEERQS